MEAGGWSQALERILEHVGTILRAPTLQNVQTRDRCVIARWGVDPATGCASKRPLPVLCRFLGRLDDAPVHALGREASEKRQGTKSREVGHRRCRGRYGDSAAVRDLSAGE